MRIGLALVVPLGGLTLGWMAAGCSKAQGQSGENPTSSPAPVELAVYKEDFGQISQRQPLDLKQGDNSVRLSQVSRQLDPESLIFRAADGAQA